MKILNTILIAVLLLTSFGCGQPEKNPEKNGLKGQTGSGFFLARAEFIPIKETVLFPPFSTEVVEMAREGSIASAGSEIARLSPGERVDQLLVESAELEKVSLKVELEKIKLQMADEIERKKLDLAAIELERCQIEYDRALDGRDWQRLLELEEGLKLGMLREKLLGRQVQAAQQMVSRGFIAQQELLQNNKELTVAMINASLTRRLIPFVDKFPDEKKVKQAYEALEKSKKTYEVASFTFNKNLAEYHFLLNEEKRNYEEMARRVKKLEDEIASLSIVASGSGLLIYGSSYSGSELVKVRIGSQVYPGVSMMRIVDPGRFGVSFDVDPREIMMTMPGCKVYFRPDAYPEKLIGCKVNSMVPLALEIRGGKPDGRTRVNLKADLEDKVENLKLGFSGIAFSPKILDQWQNSFLGNRTFHMVKKKMTRKTSTTGEVKPASFSYIISMSDSKLNHIEEEGRTVETGHVLAKLDHTEDSQNLGDTEIEHSKLKEELQLLVEKNQIDDEQLKRKIEVKRGALEVARLKHAALLKSRDEDAIIDLKRSLELVNAKIDLANEKVAHVKALRAKGLRSELEELQAEAEVADLLKEKAITAYKLELEDSGPTRRSVALSLLEVKKAETELAMTEKEVSLGRITNSMNVKIKELEIRKLEIRIKEYQHLIEMAEIKAPCNGVVIHNETHRSSGGLGKAKVGDEIYARVPFMQVAEIDNLQVHTEVSEMDAKFIKPGNQVNVLLKGNSVSSFPGWVSSVAYVAQTDFKIRQDAVVKVVIDLVSEKHGVKKVDSAFRPGQSCEVEFLLYDHPQVLHVPYDAVLPLASGPCIVDENRQLKKVEILFSDGLHGYAIESGAQEGDDILLMEARDDQS